MIEVQEFKMAPHGNSEEKDYDLLCHAEIEPEAVEKKGEGSEEEEEEIVEDQPILKMTVPKIQDHWLEM